MFDRVRIKTTPETERLGYSGLVGTVHGVTTPSVTGVEVVGDGIDDVAVNVDFEGGPSTGWFHPDIVEFVDHGGEQVLEIGRSAFVRNGDGEWRPEVRKPWWRFW